MLPPVLNQHHPEIQPKWQHIHEQSVLELCMRKLILQSTEIPQWCGGNGHGWPLKP